MHQRSCADGGQSAIKFASRWEALRPQDSALESREGALKAIGCPSARDHCLFFFFFATSSVCTSNICRVYFNDAQFAAVIAEKREEFEELGREAEKIQRDCGHFGLPAPELPEVCPHLRPPAHHHRLHRCAATWRPWAKCGAFCRRWVGSLSEFRSIDRHPALLSLQFLQGLDTIASEDWLALRSRTFVFSDYLDQWGGRLSNLPPTMAWPAE